MTDEFDFTPDEMTEFALGSAKQSPHIMSCRLNWNGNVPTVWVAFDKRICVPQTPLHKILQREYEMAAFVDVTIGGTTAVSYMHRDNYDYVVESTIEHEAVTVE